MSETTPHTPEATGAPATGPTVSSFAMIRTLVLVAGVSGVLIGLVYQITLPIIQANQAAAVQAAVLQVLPGVTQVQTFVLQPNGSLTPQDNPDARAVRVHGGYAADGGLVGVAVEAQGQGYQDVIRVIYGYLPAEERIVGMRVLESKETPGLGDKIGKDPKFLANFEDMDVKLDGAAQALVHPLQVVKSGTGQERWEIDSITGATISSNAIGKLMNASAVERLPMVLRNLNILEQGAP